MKIGILVLSTGEYFSRYWFLKAGIEEYFLKGSEKKFFIFTDKKRIPTRNEEIVFINHLPWPLITLLRFHYFEQQDFYGYDYLFYLDSDMEVVNTISEDILPTDSRILAVRHPLKRNFENHFETNNISTAYVNADNTTPYFQACFFGGKTESMANMFKTLSGNIKKDLANNFIAKWHDESHLNHYFFHNKPVVLGEEYAFPDLNRWKGYRTDLTPRIIHFNQKSS